MSEENKNIDAENAETAAENAAENTTETTEE